jgi:competence protein ComGC
MSKILTILMLMMMVVVVIMMMIMIFDPEVHNYASPATREGLLATVNPSKEHDHRENSLDRTRPFNVITAHKVTVVYFNEQSFFLPSFMRSSVM